jgi:hypothetical protein
MPIPENSLQAYERESNGRIEAGLGAYLFIEGT